MARYKLVPGKTVRWGDFEATALDDSKASVTIIDTQVALTDMQVSHLIEVLTGISEWNPRED